ncbi:MAG: thermonuclease family protein, partial [Deltaproteobacteria bacterium]|nr:thermonuclease family protein [Deltaproteobacteria bacterium]
MPTRTLRRSTLLLAAIALALAPACGTTKSERRYSKAQAAASLARFESIGLEIGEFSIDGGESVIDGDTIRVKGLKSSMRLSCIDTEETFKKAEERRAYAEGWATYLKKMRGNSDRPVKIASPLGEDAKHFAQQFFRGVTRVRLERDTSGEIRDFYGRYLAYVFVEKDGKWVNYNVECVRAGMSPYFTKYSYSRRFHKEFEEAQEQARSAQVGIWDPNKEHYPDYDERILWWNARAEVIAAFEKDAARATNFYQLPRWDTFKQLEKRVGQEVVLLGSVSEIRLGDSGPTIVKLARTRTSSFDVVFFDKDVFLSSGMQKAKGEYVRVKGVVRKYRNKHNNTDQLQLIVNAPGQVMLAGEQLDDLLDNGGRRVEAVPAEKGSIRV